MSEDECNMANNQKEKQKKLSNIAQTAGGPRNKIIRPNALPHHQTMSFHTTAVRIHLLLQQHIQLQKSNHDTFKCTGEGLY